VEAFLAGLEGTAVAQALRVSRWGYAAVNAAHIFGIALLVGSVVPLNLRLLGLWRSVPLRTIGRVLVPMAVAGLVLAATAGVILFSVRAREYAGLGVLQLKLALIAVAVASAAAAVRTHGMALDRDDGLKLHAVVSLACWLGALVCGRLIAFAGE